MEAGREIWHLVDTLGLSGSSAGVAVLKSRGGTAIASHVKQKWRQAERKARLKAPLREPSCAWRSEVGTGWVNSHHLLRLGHS